MQRVRNRGSLGTRSVARRSAPHQDDAPSPRVRHPLDAERDHCQRFGERRAGDGGPRLERDAARPALEELTLSHFSSESMPSLTALAVKQARPRLCQAFVPGGGFKQPEWRSGGNRDRHLWKSGGTVAAKRKDEHTTACRATRMCRSRPLWLETGGAQSGRGTTLAEGHWSNLIEKFEDDAHATASGCSMKGMWPAPGMTTILAPAAGAPVADSSE